MLISPPFLLPRNANENDADFVARCMPASSVMVQGTQLPEGSFPVSFKLGWHGGLHLQAPLDAAGAVQGVRAIADGEIVYVRRPTPRNATPSPGEPRNYNPYGGAPAWTDDGCVIIRHHTEIGADAQDQPVELSFLSIYMHLAELRGAAHQLASGAQDRAVYRKDEIGLAGMIYGADHQLHLEIVCDDASLQALINRLAGDLNTATDGRTDVVFGEMYFRLPTGTRFFAQRPGHDETTPAAQATHTLQGDPLIVGLRYAGGDGAQGQRGDAYLTSYTEAGAALGDPLNEADAEYDLYRTANDISDAYPANARPAPSAVYELLRFGRVIGPDPLVPADVPHWREVRHPGGQGWVNLNADGVRKFSDADFPHWRGWKLIDDDVDGDSRCESAALIGLIEDPKDADGTLTRAELERRLQLPAVRKRLEHTICRFPSEWDRASAQRRWSWLRSDAEFGLDAGDFAELLAHVEALTIPWAGAGTGMGATHWHWEPRMFTMHFGTSRWLSGDELSRIYTAASRANISAHIAALNRTMSRYNILSALRQSHFLGQGAVESDFLRAMQEKSMEGTVQATRLLGRRINQSSVTPEATLGHWYGAIPAEDDPWFRLEKYNSRGVRISRSYSWVNGNVGDVHAQKYRGRGFKQLTGLANYADYWVYRGWLPLDSFDRNWWNDPQYPQRNPSAMRLRPAQIDNPQRLVTDPENCMDSGGWYMIFSRPGVMAAIDNDELNGAVTAAEQNRERMTSRAVTLAINGGYIDAGRRLQFTRHAKTILL